MLLLLLLLFQQYRGGRIILVMQVVLVLVIFFVILVPPFGRRLRWLRDGHRRHVGDRRSHGDRLPTVLVRRRHRGRVPHEDLVFHRMLLGVAVVVDVGGRRGGPAGGRADRGGHVAGAPARGQVHYQLGAGLAPLPAPLAPGRLELGGRHRRWRRRRLLLLLLLLLQLLQVMLLILLFV